MMAQAWLAIQAFSMASASDNAAVAEALRKAATAMLLIVDGLRTPTGMNPETRALASSLAYDSRRAARDISSADGNDNLQFAADRAYQAAEASLLLLGENLMLTIAHNEFGELMASVTAAAPDQPELREPLIEWSDLRFEVI